MKFIITKYSVEKARKTVANSSKIEGYKPLNNKKLQTKIHKIAEKLCA